MGQFLVSYNTYAPSDSLRRRSRSRGLASGSSGPAVSLQPRHVTAMFWLQNRVDVRGAGLVHGERIARRMRKRPYGELHRWRGTARLTVAMAARQALQQLHSVFNSASPLCPVIPLSTFTTCRTTCPVRSRCGNRSASARSSRGSTVTSLPFGISDVALPRRNNGRRGLTRRSRLD